MSATIGLRKETKSVWERRVAFTPTQVRQLVDQGIRVLVESSTSRCFGNHEYQEAGAEIVTDLSSATIIFGIKEVGINELLEGKTYVFFSHIRKAQPYNMPLMDAMLSKKIQLIDYEVITEPRPPYHRRVAFGEFAGMVGINDFFQGLGRFLLYNSISSPFLYQGFAFNYPWLADAKANLEKVGELIANEGLDSSISPLIFGVTGSGRVSIGAQEILKILPYEYLSVEQFESLTDLSGLSNKKVYIVVFETRHLYERIEGGGFDREEFRSGPKLYKSVFNKYLSKLSVVVHCVYWEQTSPIIVAEADLRANKGRLLGICDISCDLRGGVQICRKFTTPTQPFYLYSPEQNKIFEFTEHFVQGTILMHAMDFLPTELAKDASSHFGERMMPFMSQFVRANFEAPLTEQGLPIELENATMLLQGELTQYYKYIPKLRRKSEQEMKDVEVDPISEIVNNSPSLINDLIQAQHGDPISEESKQAILQMAQAIQESN